MLLPEQHSQKTVHALQALRSIKFQGPFAGLQAAAVTELAQNISQVNVSCPQSEPAEFAIQEGDVKAFAVVTNDQRKGTYVIGELFEVLAANEGPHISAIEGGNSSNIIVG